MLPTGTVTFLFTDIEGSTRLWEAHPVAMQTALARHDELLRSAVGAHAGHVVKSTGDGVLAVFSTSSDAIAAALAGQSSLAAEVWSEIPSLRIRMGVHTGSAESRDGDYFGATLNRAARLMAAGHGGQIVCSQSTADLVRDALPPQCRLRDLGEHRLPDLGQPERVFQLEHPDLPATFPPLRSLNRYPGRLPVQLTSLWGREHDVETVIGAIERSHVVTLLGVGGVGKTRLALQAAADALPDYPDGAWFCELATITDRDAVPDAVVACLGIRPQPGEPPVTTLLAFLRNKQLLLLLDNCEHVIDAAGSLAEAIAHSCPNVRLLATSREALAIDGELLVPVRSLGLAGDDATAIEMMNAVSVRLFEDRAQAVRPDFAVDETTAPVVMDICRQLDGVPLAIELAAARVGSMTVHEISQRLDHRFRLLAGGRRTALERHQTLRRAVDWSYELLLPADATVLNRLSVFAGGLTLDAAEQIVSDASFDRDDVLDALSRLVARSMVVADVHEGATRYRLLETIREYARERLDASGESESFRQRHGEYYVALAQRVSDGLKGPDEVHWVAIVRAEIANFRSAIDWFVASRDLDNAFALVLALGGFQVQRLQYDIWRWLERVTEMPESWHDPRRAHALACSLMPEFVTSADITAMSQRLDEMDAAFASTGSELTSVACFAHAIFASVSGGVDEMAPYGDRAVALALACGDAHLAGFQLAMMSMFYAVADRTEDALRAAEGSRALASTVRNPSMRAVSETAQGYAMARTDVDGAVEHLGVAISMSEIVDNVLGGDISARCLARIRAARGDLVGALALYERCLDLGERTAARMPLLLTLASLAGDLASAHEWSAAAKLAGGLESNREQIAAQPGREGVDELIATVRRALDADEAERRITSGRSLDVDELVGYARDEIDRIRSTRLPLDTNPSPCR